MPVNAASGPAADLVPGRWLDRTVELLIGSGALADTGEWADCALVAGPPGTGRSAVLGSAEKRLRDAGADVVAGLPKQLVVECDARSPGRCPIVVADDLHTWPAGLVDDLVHRLDHGAVRLVASTEERRREPRIAALIARARRSDTLLARRPMSTGQVIDAASRSGLALTPVEAAHIRRTCGGASALIDVVLDAVYGDDIEDPEAVHELSPVDIAARISRDWHHRLLGDLDDDTLDVLVLASSGGRLDSHTVAALLDLDPADAAVVVDRARGTGFLSPRDRFLPALTGTLRDVVGGMRIDAVQRRVALAQLTSGTMTADDAIRAVDAGLTDPRIVETLCAAAGDAPRDRAAALLATAERGGGATEVLRPRRARLALGGGDVVAAGALIDEVLVGLRAPSDQAADAVVVASEVATAAGRATHAADLFRWLGADHCTGHRPAAVAVLLAVGDRRAAQTFGVGGTGPPSTLRHAHGTVIRYLLGGDDEEVSGDAVVHAWAAVGDAVTLRACVWPVFASAIQRGENDAARALADILEPTSADRQGLLRTWSAVAAGDLAGLDIEQTTDPARIAVETRPDRRLRWAAAALGVARIAGRKDLASPLWRMIAPTVATMEVALFDLLVLGECRRVAMWLGDADRLDRQLTAVDNLLAGFDSGSAWQRVWQTVRDEGAHVATSGSSPTTVVDGPLTEREAEVARELLAGYTYREIGDRLFISAKTVEHHVANIRRRLEAGSRSELMAAIRDAGYH
ncbi:LuxR C-terminal-related transcriptional regulator [Gordonia sp. LSe1-13]|uniref:LuxR C-terminal-related transcriptional regulator n=1 Tax=Gordonia sesuvii TaxID=3116777 RepID=A0ABU7MA27_9ACTN|nr:LuxR C-terminal-related transcriptional regulator [Gordonia sp. LSe1-13]